MTERSFIKDALRKFYLRLRTIFADKTTVNSISNRVDTVSDNLTTLANQVSEDETNFGVFKKGNGSNSIRRNIVGSSSNGNFSFSSGNYTRTENTNEFAAGALNKSNIGDTDADKTRFSIGIGANAVNRKNALEVMSNGDTYLCGIGDYDGTNPNNAYTIKDVIDHKQDILVSGQNIKTVNMQSLVGSGNISIPTEKDYAANNPNSSQYIQNRPGGYDYTLYYEDIEFDAITLSREDATQNYIVEEIISGSGSEFTLRKLAENGIIIPCAYIPSDGIYSDTSVNGTITYEEEGEGMTLHAAEDDDSTEVIGITITPANIPGGILEDDVYHFPIQFPSKYIPNDSTKQDVLTFDNVPTQNSNNPVKSGGVYNGLKAINDLVPAQASAENKLADKNFVNSTVQTETATFRGNYDTWEDVPDTGDAWESAPDNNDYLVVRDASNYAPIWDNDWAGISGYPGFVVGDIVTDYSETLEKYVLCRCITDINYNEEPEESSPANNTTHFEIVTSNPNYDGTWRFKYPDSRDYDKYNWLPEYQVNEKPLTAAQLAALNSGITDTKVTKLDALPATIPTEVFWATYGVTTAAEVEAALTAGKVVMCNYSNITYLLTLVDSTNYTFTAVANSQVVYILRLKISDSSWTNDYSVLQKTSNLVTSFQSTPDNTHYPSEKLVYDSLKTDEEVSASALIQLEQKKLDKASLVQSYDIYVPDARNKVASAYALWSFTQGLKVSGAMEEVAAAALCQLNALSAMSSAVAPVYGKDKMTFAVDDCCMYQSRFYRCTTAVAQVEAFDPAKWTKTTLFDEIVRRINNI